MKDEFANDPHITNKTPNGIYANRRLKQETTPATYMPDAETFKEDCYKQINKELKVFLMFTPEEIDELMKPYKKPLPTLYEAKMVDKLSKMKEVVINYKKNGYIF